MHGLKVHVTVQRAQSVRGRPGVAAARESGPSGTTRRLVAARNDAGKTDQPTGKVVAEQQGDVNEPVAGSEVPKGLAKGQGTAIVTGAISILFGIAYLALVQMMDMRGGELQPPPPEAFLN